MQPGRNDGGDKDVGRVSFPNHPGIDNLQAVNSWWPIAHNIDRCYGCKYCIVGEYYNESAGKRVGFPPAELVDRMEVI